MSKKRSRKADVQEQNDVDVDDPIATAIEDAAASSSNSDGNPIYTLGMIGALVWFWSGAETTEERAIAVLKAIAWPAFLVHDAFKALSD